MIPIILNNGGNIKSNWLPSTSEIPFNSSFASRKIGCMISYAMTTYTASDSYAINRFITPPLSSIFNPPANIESLASGWIDSLEATGKIDYYIFTTSHQIGFSLWDTNVDLTQNEVNDAFFGTITLPIRSNYKHSTYDIIESLKNRALLYNKPFWLYYNIGRKINYRGSNAYGDQDLYYNFVKGQLIELMQKYNPEGLWLDAPSETPWNTNELSGEYLNNLYTALKNVNKNIKITLNYFYDNTLYSGGNLRIFPCDVISLERGVGRDLIDTSEYNYPKTNQGNSYYINSEDVTHNNDELIYFGVDNKSGTPVSQSQMQTWYDASKSVNVPLTINVSPSQNGTLSQWQIDLIDNLTL